MTEKPISINTGIDNLLSESDESQPSEPSKDEKLDQLLTESDAEAEEEEAHQEEIPQVDEVEIEPDKVYLQDFAKDTEVDIADAYQLSIKMQIPEGEMTISEMKDFIVENHDIMGKRQEIETKEQDLSEREDAFRNVPQVTNELMQARAKVLAIQDQYNATNWEQLRVDNPAEWTARQQEFQLAFQAAKSQEAVAQEGVTTQQQQARQFARDRLFEAMPELKDAKVAQEAEARVNQFAGRYGFTAQDVANIDNPNLMRLLIDVSKLDVAKEQAKQKLKDKTPRASKPKKPIISTRKASLNKLKQRAMGGSKKDKSAFIDALLT